VTFSIERGVKPADVGVGTVRRGSVTCPVCGYTTPVAAVREQARIRGLPERLVAVVTTTPHEQGRTYRLPEDRDLAAVAAATLELRRRKETHTGRLSLVPDEPLPIGYSQAFPITVWGPKTWGDLFTDRQALSLSTLAGLVSGSRSDIALDVGNQGLADAITTCLGLAVDRLADRLCSLSTWRPQADQEKVEHVFTRQALPITWDFAEGNPLSPGTASWRDSYEPPSRLVEQVAQQVRRQGTVSMATATRLPLPDGLAQAVITDPPYYDAVPYSDLSDFFYVWLRRSLGDLHADILRDPLTPKKAEIVVNPATIAGREKKLGPFFEQEIEKAFREARRVLADDGLGIIVFAHKSTAGWESMLQALVSARWTVTGSWPIDTEMGARLRARDSAALASSVHLVCRPRRSNAGVGDWSAILRELQPRVDLWMKRLSAEGVVGADAIFACLGPAIELYSRYDRVETAAGVEVPLGGRSANGDDYLTHVWSAVARAALKTIFDEAEASGFEPDGRLAAVWLWTVGAGKTTRNGEASEDQANGIEEDDEEARPEAKAGGFPLPYDTARKLAQPLGADLGALTARPGSAFELRGDTARLVAVRDRRSFLFPDSGLSPAVPHRRNSQAELFEDLGPTVASGGVTPGSSTLDRLHQAMLLFADERGDALRRLLIEDGAGHEPRFWRLADAMSKLYPITSPEKRWVDGVLARKRALGL
jgi:putative DNA methylase